MNKLKLFFVFLISVLCQQEVAAQPFQTLAGGEIYYEIIGAKKYKVTAHVYRMCDMPTLSGLIAYVYGGPYKLPMSFTRVSISRMDDKCNLGNPCNQQNAISNAGFEKHTFEDTVDFNKSPYDTIVSNNTCTVKFAIRMNGRSWTVTTYDPYNAFYLEASTNICLSAITKNSSPRFSMEPKFQAYCNMPFVYSPGPLDTTDNDSFAISLADIESDINTKVSYKSNFSAQYPVTPFCTSQNCTPLPNASPPKGFYFDKQTCMIVYTPVRCSEVATIKYRIDEYRFNKLKQKHEWLGFVTREMMVQVLNSTGNNPTAIPTSNILNLCKGNKICTTVSTADTKGVSQSAADTTTLFWDKGIKDATFKISDSTAREKQGVFCLQTSNKSGRTETSFFTVAAYDKQCNINLVSKTFAVNVNPTHPYQYKNTIAKCGLVKWAVSVKDSFYPNYKGINKTVIRSFQSNKILYSGSKMNDSMKLYKDDKIIIEHTFDTLCPVTVRDTFTITGTLAIPELSYQKDTIVCKDKMLPFLFKPSLVSGLQSFKWYLNNSLFNQSDSSINVKMVANTIVRIVFENPQGCQSEKKLFYNLKQHKAMASLADTVCEGTKVTVVANTASLKQPVDCIWKINGVDTSTNNNYYDFEIKEDTKVLLSVEDANRCVFTDSVFYKILPAVKFNLDYKNAVCKDSLTVVKVKNITALQPYQYDWVIDQKSAFIYDSIILIKPSVAMNVSLTITDLNACSLKEAVQIQVVKTPEVKLGGDIQACFNSLINIKPTIGNRPSQISYIWSNSKGILGLDSFLKQKFITSQMVKLRGSNVLGCATEDDINIMLYPQTVLSIASDKNYLPKSIVSLSTSKPFKTYLWFNGRTTALNLFIAGDLGPPGNYKVWCKTTDANDCEYRDTVEITVDKDTKIGNQFLQQLKIYPNPVGNILMIETLEKSEMDLFSVDGRMLVKQVLEAGSNQIDLSLFTSGIYFIRLSVNGQTGIYKIVKE